MLGGTGSVWSSGSSAKRTQVSSRGPHPQEAQRTAAP